MNYYKAKLNLVWLEQEGISAEDMFDAYEMLRLIGKESK